MPWNRNSGWTYNHPLTEACRPHMVLLPGFNHAKLRAVPEFKVQSIQHPVSGIRTLVSSFAFLVSGWELAPRTGTSGIRYPVSRLRFLEL